MILTPAFIEKVCQIKSNQIIKEQITPVASKLTYENIEFFVELERLQIIEKNIVDFTKPKAVDYFEKYISTLEYTPTFICGINLNVTIKEFNPKTIDTAIKDKKQIINVLKTNSVTITSEEVFNEDKTNTWNGYNFKYKKDDDAFLLLGFRKKDDSIVMNLNYEIKGLNKKKERFKKIRQNLNSLVKENIKFLNYFIGKDNK